MSFQLLQIVDLNVEDITTCDLLITSHSAEPRGTIINSAVASFAYEHWAITQATHTISASHPGTVIGVEHLLSRLKQWILGSKIVRPKIVVDVSCMSRPAMAATFGAIYSTAETREITLVVAYVIASFSPPPISLPPNEDIKPISDWFAGWPSNTSASTALMVGLGYERAKAEGACEYFDASETWVFVPRSPLGEYDDAVLENNIELLGRAKRRERALDYKVASPSATFGQLASIVGNLLPRSNPVLLPFGPKIFFAISLLVGAIYREVGVWHVTGDADIAEASHTPSDFTVAFQADLRPSRDWDTPKIVDIEGIKN